MVVKFKSDAVRFGDPQAAAPFALQCNKTQKGQGRWTSAREVVQVFLMTKSKQLSNLVLPKLTLILNAKSHSLTQLVNLLVTTKQTKLPYQQTNRYAVDGAKPVLVLFRLCIGYINR